LRAAAALAAAWLSCCSEGERPDAPIEDALVGLRPLVGEEAREEERDEVREASRDARRAAAAAARASFSSTSLMSFSSQLRNSWASCGERKGTGRGGEKLSRPAGHNFGDPVEVKSCRALAGMLDCQPLLAAR
jgi:hypothetical protein